METENFHVLEEKEEERDIIECPYKKFKFDDDTFNIDEDASFVTKNENPSPMDTSINGGGVGIYNPQELKLDVNREPVVEPMGDRVDDEAEADGEPGSENGEETKMSRFFIRCNNRRFQDPDQTTHQIQMTTTRKLNLYWIKLCPMS